MSSPLLSFCIPTYRRAQYLGATLQSICDDSEGSPIEIVVSDNGSKDGTDRLVAEFRSRYRNIIFTFFAWPTNVGADRNYLKAVELASGTYCWLFGSDDSLIRGSIAAVTSALHKWTNAAGISVESIEYDKALSLPIGQRTPLNATFPQLLEGAENIYTKLGHWWGYLSAQIVNRNIWNMVCQRSKCDSFLNGYVHVYVMAQMVQERPEWLYLNRRCVKTRTGNDSFLEAGAYNRLRLDLDGYRDITAAVFGADSRTFRAVMRVMHTIYFRRYGIGRLKAAHASGRALLQASKLGWRHFGGEVDFWILTLPRLFTPRLVLLWAAHVVRRFRRSPRM